MKQGRVAVLEIKQPPQPDGILKGGLFSNDAKDSITAQAENDKPSGNPTWKDCETYLISRYVKGGISEASALLFAQGEINAIQAGNHYSRDASGTMRVTPPDPQVVIIHALIERELTAAEKDAYNELAGKPETEPRKYEGRAALAEYAKRGIRLMPCVPVEDDPKKYRPITGKEKWPDVATNDIKRIGQYQSGALWPNAPISLFRFIPAEAGLLCVDIDKGHSNGVDGEAEFYRLMRARGYDPLPPLLRDLRAFPVRVETPSGGLHLYFSHNGQPVEKAVLAESVEVFHSDPLTAAGSQKENKAYTLYGELDEAPPLPPELLEIITSNKKQRQAPDYSAYRKPTAVRGGDDKELLKVRLLEYVKKKGITVTKKGGKEWINCPLHDDGEPSMQINTSGRYAGILKCYACGASLNVFGLARIMAALPNGKKYFPQVAWEIKSTLGIG
jgi:hypothetical protein